MATASTFTVTDEALYNKRFEPTLKATRGSNVALGFYS